MKILLIILLSAFAITCYSQSTLPLRADTVVIEKTGGNGNLKIKDSSRNTTGGILTNIGGGAYTGKKPRRINDSTFIIGIDTIIIKGGTDAVAWCNIVNNGADATGTINASPYIQALIDAGCKYIYIPSGVYLISSTIQLRDSVTIKGDGRNNTVIKLTTNIPAFHVGQVGQYSQFLDFDIQGNKAAGATTAQEGIFCDSATIYVNNVGGYDVGGFVLRFKHDLYNRPYPFGGSLIGSLVSDCNFEKCYGGIKIDSSAEYIGVSNTVMVSNTYGLHVIGGNSRISNCNMSANSYGIYMTPGPNGHHGVASNNNINHNTYNIYMDSVLAGFSFVGNMIYAGTNQLYIESCYNIEFIGGDLVGTGTATFLNNDTTIHFLDVNMRTKPTWAITGNAPTIISTRESPLSLTMFDAVNNKKFNVSYANDSTTFSGNLKLFKIPSGRFRVGSPTSSTHRMVINNVDTPALKTLAAFGPHLSNSIAVTVFDDDTLTSTNSATILSRPMQVHKRMLVKDDGLNLGSRRALFTALNVPGNLNNTITNSQSQSYGSVASTVIYSQYPGITGTSIFNAPSTANSSVASVAGFTQTVNNGGSSLVNLNGYYGGFATYIQMTARDTMENYIAYSSGSHEVNAAARIKTFYHHYMHSNPGQNNWGVYQEGATTPNYFQGNILAGNNINNAIDKLQVTGTARITDTLKLHNVKSPPGSYNLLAHSLTIDSGVYQVPSNGFINNQYLSAQDASFYIDSAGRMKYLNVDSFATFAPIDAPAYAEGRLFYDNTNKTLSLFDDISGTSLQLGQEHIVRVRNNSGSTITNGQAVYINGALGQNPTIALAQASTPTTSQIIGLAMHDISNNTVGKVTTNGLVNDVNTSAFTDGDKLYLSQSTPGAITNVEPTSGYNMFIGYCLTSHPTQGKIFVHAQDVLVKNISNSALNANADYSHNWKGFHLTIDSVKKFEIKTTGTVSGIRVNTNTKLLSNNSPQYETMSIIRNSANSADSLYNWFDLSSGATRVMASGNASPFRSAAATVTATTSDHAVELSATQLIPAKQSIATVNSSQIRLNGSDSITLVGTATASTADSVFVPVRGELVTTSSGTRYSYKIARMPMPQKFTQTATVTVSANDAETTLIGSGSGSLIIPANYLIAGKTYRVTVRGKYSTDATNPAQLKFRAKLGTTAICETGNTGVGTNKTDINYEVHVEFTCRTTGATGTVMAIGQFHTVDGPGATSLSGSGTFSTATIDTTSANTFDFTIDMTDGSAGNSVVAYVVVFEEI